MPVTKKEWLDARLNCKVGDSIRVFNHWREDLKAKQGKEGKGRWEKSRIKKKFSFIVLLENGRSVDYAEVAMQLVFDDKWQEMKAEKMERRK